MLETLKARKAELQAQGKKGFTLMEMLIVIAIIAILIAIAIPVFTTQLDNANKATDESNIRAGYSEVQSKIMLENITGNEEFLLQKDGTVLSSKAENPWANAYEPSTSAEASNEIYIGGKLATWNKSDGEKKNGVAYVVENGELKTITAANEK